MTQWKTFFKFLTLDSMQSTTSDDVKNGTTYLSVMQSNLDVLKQALQQEDGMAQLIVNI